MKEGAVGGRSIAGKWNPFALPLLFFPLLFFHGFFFFSRTFRFHKMASRDWSRRLVVSIIGITWARYVARVSTDLCEMSGMSFDVFSYKRRRLQPRCLASVSRNTCIWFSSIVPWVTCFTTRKNLRSYNFISSTRRANQFSLVMIVLASFRAVARRPMLNSSVFSWVKLSREIFYSE